MSEQDDTNEHAGPTQAELDAMGLGDIYKLVWRQARLLEKDALLRERLAQAERQEQALRAMCDEWEAMSAEWNEERERRIKDNNKLRRRVRRLELLARSFADVAIGGSRQ